METSADPDALGDGAHWGPIELLAAALSGCLFHAALDVARRSSVALVGWTDTVTLTVGRDPGGPRQVQRAQVSVRAEVAPGSRVERARRVLHKAHALCVVARSLAVAVDFELEVVEAVPAPTSVG